MKGDTRSLSLAVLPGSRNRIRLQPKVAACWGVGDGVFDLGHKFIGADARDDFRRSHAIGKKHLAAPIALFGDTDAVASEAYNHQLGYKLAIAGCPASRRWAAPSLQVRGRDLLPTRPTSEQR